MKIKRVAYDYAQWKGPDFVHYIKLRLADRGIPYAPKDYTKDIIMMHTLLKWARQRVVSYAYVAARLDEILDKVISTKVTSLCFLHRYFKELKPTPSEARPPDTVFHEIKFSEKTLVKLRNLKNIHRSK